MSKTSRINVGARARLATQTGLAKHIQGELDPYDLLSAGRKAEARKEARERFELLALQARLAGQKTGLGSGSSDAELALLGQGEISDALGQGGVPSTGTPPPRGPTPGKGEGKKGGGGKR